MYWEIKIISSSQIDLDSIVCCANEAGLDVFESVEF